MPQVGFDHNFFAKSLNDYSDWYWSFARESMQNCMDSGAKEIRVNITALDNRVVVSFGNDGRPMDRSTLENKLMNVGGTTKTGNGGQGEVGGFGVAKIVLYFAHLNYSIRSGNHQIQGQGGSYEISECSQLDGTESIVEIQSSDPEQLAKRIKNKFLQFAAYAQWNGSFFVTYEGETKHYACALRKGYFRREFSFGRLYTNKQYNNLLIFRINGIPMFTKYISYEGCAVFEATKGSIELMTSNRDGLKYRYQNEIDDVIQRFGTNRASVLNREPTMEIFGNTLLDVVDTPTKPAPAPVAPKETMPHNDCDNEDAPEPQEEPRDEEEHEESGLYKGLFVAARQGHDERQNNDPNNGFERPLTKVGYQQRFMLLNESGMTTPHYVVPGNMSSYCERLKEIWAKLMCEVYRINKKTGAFAIGFCLGDAIAKHYAHEGVTYYLINPFKIVEQDASNSRSFKKRYNLVRDREDLIMSAVHEFIHGAIGHSWHDETYAAYLTTLAGVAMKHSKELKRCFR